MKAKNKAGAKRIQKRANRLQERSKSTKLSNSHHQPLHTHTRQPKNSIHKYRYRYGTPSSELTLFIYFLAVADAPDAAESSFNACTTTARYRSVPSFTLAMAVLISLNANFSFYSPPPITPQPITAHHKQHHLKKISHHKTKQNTFWYHHRQTQR